MTQQLLYQTIQHLNDYIEFLKQNADMSLDQPPGLAVVEEVQGNASDDQEFVNQIKQLCDVFSKNLQQFGEDVQRGCNLLGQKVWTISDAIK